MTPLIMGEITPVKPMSFLAIYRDPMSLHRYRLARGVHLVGGGFRYILNVQRAHGPVR